MGNILRYFLDKYGRLYDKKARFLSEPSLHGRTECCQGNMRIHSASIAVCKPPPLYYTPGVGLPLHPSTSALVMPRSRSPPFPFSPRHAPLPLSARSACSCHFTHKAAT